MGVADFAFSNSVSFRRRQPTGEPTEIVLEPKGATVVAKNKWGQALYTLNVEGDGGYSMRDNHGHAVLTSRRDPQRHNAFNIFDKEGHIIGRSSGGSFHWEQVAMSWVAKSFGVISDAIIVAYKDSEQPDGHKSPTEEDLLAEFKPAHSKTPGILRVPYEVVSSHSLPPLGLFLFEAMILNQGYLHSSPLQRISMTSSFRKK